jgi:hypothetical protein
MRTSNVNDEARCPACLKKINAATHPLGDADPVPGDCSVCVYCGTVNVFQTDMTVRTMRQDELLALPLPLQCELAVARYIVVKLQEQKESRR